MAHVPFQLKPFDSNVVARHGKVKYVSFHSCLKSQPCFFLFISDDMPLFVFLFLLVDLELFFAYNGLLSQVPLATYSFYIYFLL